MKHSQPSRWSRSQTPNQIPRLPFIGMRCRLSGNTGTPEALWNACANAANTGSTVPADRFNTKAFFHPEAYNRGTSGHFIEEDIFAFDAAFFNLTAEAAAVNADDTWQWTLKFDCNWNVSEAFESAGMPTDDMAGSLTSVYSAYSFKDYQERLITDSDNLPRPFLNGVGGAMLANRVSHF
ncbi:hypothetical protein BO71DRAFT_428897 [Aspergillus ellipticus CBS 707.79]|uniref:Beta-ketoacyl synthase-like N-terminal domain-containing protein n=1 Tax=Aspergillus ellipticus CBS 707.79 TaxID=1448320 RepID=A0A319DNK5_9EURO|nr:hypothetical protein BO71DRAFT_428897 [Aspergillus ellipticus CBS 707.79]